MRCLLLLAVGLCGCDYAFGLREVDIDLDEGATVTGSYAYRFVTNGPDGMPWPQERFIPATALGITATLDDGTVVPVDYDDNTGGFSFPVSYAGQSYRLVITSADIPRAEFQASLPHIQLGGYLGGRVDRLPLARSLVNYTTTAPNSYVASTGLYSYTYTAMTGAVSFDWRLVTQSGSTTGLLDASKYDRLYAIDTEALTAFNSPPFTRIKAVSSAEVTQTANSISTLPSPVAVVPDVCTHLVAPNVAELARIQAANPSYVYANVATDWYTYSAAAPSWIGLSGAMWVTACGVAGSVRDFDVTPEFHNPYPGHALVATTGITAQFEVAVGTALPVRMSNASRTYQVAKLGTPGACGEVTDLTVHTAIPGGLALDDAPLDTDAQSIVLDRRRDAILTWTDAMPGLSDLYSVTLGELVVVNNTTTLVVRSSAVVVDRQSARLEPSLLEAGKTYIVAVSSILGRPNIADGDLLTLAPPYETSTMWSRTFIPSDSLQ